MSRSGELLYPIYKFPVTKMFSTSELYPTLSLALVVTHIITNKDNSNQIHFIGQSYCRAIGRVPVTPPTFVLWYSPTVQTQTLTTDKTPKDAFLIVFYSKRGS